MKILVNNDEELVAYFISEFNHDCAEGMLGVEFSDRFGRFAGSEEGFDDTEYGDNWKVLPGDHHASVGFPEKYPCLIVISEEYCEISYVYPSDFGTLLETEKPKRTQEAQGTLLEEQNDQIWSFGNFESLCK